MQISQAVLSEKEAIKTVPTEVSTKSSSEDDMNAYSNKLARVGEIMAQSPVGIYHASDLFKMALKANPNNNKAKLYGAMTNIAMQFEGVIGKSIKLFEGKKAYDAALQSLEQRMR